MRGSVPTRKKAKGSSSHLASLYCVFTNSTVNSTVKVYNEAAREPLELYCSHDLREGANSTTLEV